MENNAIAKISQKVNVQSLVVPNEHIKVLKKWVKNKKGKKYLIKMYQVLSTPRRIFDKIDDSFSKYKGYHNRLDLLTSLERLHDVDKDLVCDPETGAIYTLTRTPPKNLYLLN